jgi:hypothetical protein
MAKTPSLNASSRALPIERGYEIQSFAPAASLPGLEPAVDRRHRFVGGR